MPGTFAYLVLLLWVPVAVGLYASLRPRTATMVILFVATLLLPGRVAFDAPMLPALGRGTLSALCALMGCLVFARNRLASRLPGTGVDLLALVMLAGGWITSLTNKEPISWGRTMLPGLTQYDGLSMAIEHTLVLWIPFYLGRVFFRRPRELQILLSWLVVAGLLYSLPIFIELRLSPQLHKLVYGYDLMHYVAARRWGGWRPTVFMEHGLALALFMLNAALAAAGLARARFRIRRVPMRKAAVYLAFVMVLCKGLAALVYGVFSFLILLRSRPRIQLLLASMFVASVFAYPMLRTVDAFPTDALVHISSYASEDRAESLKFRFDNDDKLLAWARNKIWFGWGKWSRHRVFDSRSGVDVAITDGYWIVILGQLGIVGFVSSVGLLLTPVWLAAARSGRIGSRRDRILIATTALIVTVNGVDLLPNAMLTPLSVFISGALAGAVEGLRKSARPLPPAGEGRPSPAAPEPPGEGPVPRAASLIDSIRNDDRRPARPNVRRS